MFKVHDLMINVLGGGGGAAMPGPDDDTPPSPISPVAVVAAYADRFHEIDRVVQLSDKVDVKVLDQIALEVGRAVVGARIAALCTEDMATCDANPRISPIASFGQGILRSADYGLIRDQVLDASKWVNQRGDELEKAAVEHKAELLPLLERATEYLRAPSG